jgi:hypothetical protein
VSHPGDTAKASFGGPIGPFSLDALADFCRARGVDRLEVAFGEARVVLVMGAPVAEPAAPARELTPEEVAKAERRAHLRRILGRDPTAHEMDVLP